MVPEQKDLFMALDYEQVTKADGSGSPVATPPLRSTMLLEQMVRKVRAAIQNAGHTPLSVTPGSVPPEAFDHVVYMAAWRLVNSKAGLQMVVLTENGAYAPLATFNKAAEEWMDGRVEGGRRIGGIATHAITPPTDPCGRDWVNPVCVPVKGGGAFDYLTFNPPIKGTVRQGSLEAPVDLRTGSPQMFPKWAQDKLGSP